MPCHFSLPPGPKDASFPRPQLTSPRCHFKCNATPSPHSTRATTGSERLASKWPHLPRLHGFMASRMPLRSTVCTVCTRKLLHTSTTCPYTHTLPPAPCKVGTSPDRLIEQYSYSIASRPSFFAFFFPFSLSPFSISMPSRQSFFIRSADSCNCLHLGSLAPAGAHNKPAR